MSGLSESEKRQSPSTFFQVLDCHLLIRQTISGTFAIYNVEMFGINHFTGTNPPQSCILVVGLTEAKLVPALEEECGCKVVQVLLGICKAGTNFRTHVGGKLVDIIK